MKQPTISFEVGIDEAKEILAAREKALAEKEAKRDELDRDIAASRKGIEDLRSKIQGQAILGTPVARILDRAVEMISEGNINRVNGGVWAARAPRGQNLKLVTDFLRANPEGKTIGEIADALGLGFTSVQVVLNRHSDQFEKDENSRRWRFKDEKYK
jgi:hypothetical protein